MSDHFDETTARWLMTRRITTTDGQHSKGATARVVCVDRFDELPDKWAVGVQWEPVRATSRIDWFAKRQFESYFGDVARS